MNIQKIGQWLQDVTRAESPPPQKPTPQSSPQKKPLASLAPQDKVSKPAQKGMGQTHVALVNGKTTPIQDLKNIDSKAVFFDSNAVSAKEIDGILKHYGSPHAGKGAEMVKISKEMGINPLMMIAIMQQESSYGNKNNNASLTPENIANPWSVHFDEKADGIKKLRLKNGDLPSFSQTYKAASRTMINLSKSTNTPLTTAGKRYSTTASWTNSIKTHYATQLKRVAKMRAN